MLVFRKILRTYLMDGPMYKKFERLKLHINGSLHINGNCSIFFLYNIFCNKTRRFRIYFAVKISLHCEMETLPYCI